MSLQDIPAEIGENILSHLTLDEIYYLQKNKRELCRSLAALLDDSIAEQQKLIEYDTHRRCDSIRPHLSQAIAGMQKWHKQLPDTTAEERILKAAQYSDARSALISTRRAIYQQHHAGVPAKMLRSWESHGRVTQMVANGRYVAYVLRERNISGLYHAMLFDLLRNQTYTFPSDHAIQDLVLTDKIITYSYRYHDPSSGPDEHRQLIQELDKLPVASNGTNELDRQDLSMTNRRIAGLKSGHDYEVAGIDLYYHIYVINCKTMALELVASKRKGFLYYLILDADGLKVFSISMHGGLSIQYFIRDELAWTSTTTRHFPSMNLAGIFSNHSILSRSPTRIQVIATGMHDSWLLRFMHKDQMIYVSGDGAHAVPSNRFLWKQRAFEHIRGSIKVFSTTTGQQLGQIRVRDHPLESTSSLLVNESFLFSIDTQRPTEDEREDVGHQITVFAWDPAINSPDMREVHLSPRSG